MKLKDVRTGNTLNGKQCEHRFNFIKYPNSKFTRAIRAVNEADTEKNDGRTPLVCVRNDPTWWWNRAKNCVKSSYTDKANSTCAH